MKVLKNTAMRQVVCRRQRLFLHEIASYKRLGKFGKRHFDNNISNNNSL